MGAQASLARLALGWKSSQGCLRSQDLC